MRTLLSVCLLSAVFSLLAENKMPKLYFDPPPREIVMSKKMVSLIDNGKWDEIIELCKKSVEIAKEARSNG